MTCPQIPHIRPPIHQAPPHRPSRTSWSSRGSRARSRAMSPRPSSSSRWVRAFGVSLVGVDRYDYVTCYLHPRTTAKISSLYPPHTHTQNTSALPPRATRDTPASHPSRRGLHPWRRFLQRPDAAHQPAAGRGCRLCGRAAGIDKRLARNQWRGKMDWHLERGAVLSWFGGMWRAACGLAFLTAAAAAGGQWRHPCLYLI